MEEDIIRERKNKLEAVRAAGINPYPASFSGAEKIAGLLERFAPAATETPAQESVTAAGRLLSSRPMGKAAFFNLKDASGRIQCYIRKDIAGEERLELFKKLDLGDIIGVKGKIFKTRTGELTILVSEIILLSKCLRPLPVVKEKITGDTVEKFDEVKDIEFRYRRRYVDFLTSEESRGRFETRARILSELRKYLGDKGFTEVETPMMQAVAGGAAALPFITHHNTYDMDLFLRVAPELYLKRLLVGGFERVFEIGKCFRNEGISTKHNPEFTIVELYQAYADYRDMMQLTEEIIISIAEKVKGSLKLKKNGLDISLEKPWKRYRLPDIMKEKTGVDFLLPENSDFREIAKKLKVAVPDKAPKWKIFEHIFDACVQETLIDPTFIYDYPVQMCPLAKPSAVNPEIAERFELFVGREEIANAYSELNDPAVQAANWEAQKKARQEGDREAQEFDMEYIEALEYGMPPAGGLGIGLDRLTMLFSDAASIKDVILFPFLRPEKV